MSEDLFERRQDERRYALNFLDFEILDADGKVAGRGLARTLDVSENGLRLETGQFFEPGQKLRITLGLHNELVRLVGEVVNSQPESDELCRSGVAFVTFSPGEQKTFQTYITSLRDTLPA